MIFGRDVGGSVGASAGTPRVPAVVRDVDRLVAGSSGSTEIRTAVVVSLEANGMPPTLSSRPDRFDPGRPCPRLASRLPSSMRPSRLSFLRLFSCSPPSPSRPVLSHSLSLSLSLSVVLACAPLSHHPDLIHGGRENFHGGRARFSESTRGEHAFRACGRALVPRLLGDSSSVAGIANPRTNTRQRTRKRFRSPSQTPLGFDASAALRALRALFKSLSKKFAESRAREISLLRFRVGPSHNDVVSHIARAPTPARQSQNPRIRSNRSERSSFSRRRLRKAACLSRLSSFQHCTVLQLIHVLELYRSVFLTSR